MSHKRNQFCVYIHIIRAKNFGCIVVVVIVSFRYFLLLNQNKLHLLIVVAHTAIHTCMRASGCSFPTSTICGHCQ